MTDFEKRLRAVPGDFACAGCRKVYKMRAPLILDLPMRNLLVFVTHHGDDGGVEGGFRQFLAKLAELLPPSVAQRARSTPYTFVHGHEGLFALLEAFEGVEPQPKVQPGDDFSIAVLNGYQYGKLFFYFPCHLDMEEVISASVSAAIDLEQVGQRAEAIALLDQLIKRIGASHPWLPTELGRLLLADGRTEDALSMLRQASYSTHTWHAVTISFMDPTPRRQSDGETQSGDCRPASVSSSLGDITAQRHSVVGFFPAHKDAGLWDFPKMAEAGIPEQYTLENLIAAFGYGLGRIDRGMDEDFRDHNPLESTVVGWSTLQNDCIEILQRNSKHESLFWSAFMRARWPRAWPPTLSSAGVEASKRQILELLDRLPRADDRRSSADDRRRFYLEGALTLLSRS